MQGSVLLMVPQEDRRAHLALALTECGLPALELPDFSNAMAALGRAEFVAMVCTEAQPKTLQGFCLLARKRHPRVPLFILTDPARRSGTPIPRVGVGEIILDGNQKATSLARAIAKALKETPAQPFEVPATGIVWDTLQAAVDEKLGVDGGKTESIPRQEPVRERAKPPPLPPQAHADATMLLSLKPSQLMDSAAAGALTGPKVLSGDLSEMSGSAVLMSVLGQGLSGVLALESGPAKGLLCFYAGDPVWAEDGFGDASLFQQLCTAGLLPAGTRQPEVPQGHMLGKLILGGQLNAAALERLLVHMVHERLESLCGQRAGTWAFHEHHGFLHSIPLLKMNAFALVLDWARRELSGPMLAAESERMSRTHVVGTPLLALVTDRIQPLLQGVSLASPLSTPMAMTQVWDLLGQGTPTGTLVVRALLNAGLVRTCPPKGLPRPKVELSAPLKAIEEDGFVLEDTEVGILPVAGQIHEAARDAVLELYMRIKTLTAPREVLNVPNGATRAQVDEAYKALVAKLDPAQVPPGPHLGVLVSHLKELRAKADAAHAALLMSFGAPEEPSHARGRNRVHHVKLGKALVSSNPAVRSLPLVPAGRVLVDCSELETVEGDASLHLGELAARKDVELYVTGFPLVVMGSCARGVLQALRGRLMDVIAPAKCARCAPKGSVRVNADRLPRAKESPEWNCLTCGQPARVRLSERQRVALSQWLHPNPPTELWSRVDKGRTPPPVPPPPSNPQMNLNSPVPSTTLARPRTTSQPSVKPVPELPPRLERVRMLGRGGMGEVLLVRQTGPEGFIREVALKRVLGPLVRDEEVRTMFMQEARTAARVNHPNVVPVYELGEWDGHPYLVMEYVRGWNLRVVMDAVRTAGQRVPLDVACRVVADLCAGLHAAHQAKDGQGKPLGLVHRDVSPQNILLAQEGIVKVTDFGIARALDSALLTRPGQLKGKPSYMSPEQVDGSFGPVDSRADIWSAAVVLHELCTGVHLFRTERTDQTLAAVLNGEITPVSKHRKETPAALDKAVAKALQRAPAQRPATAQVLQMSLEQVLFGLGHPTVSADVAEWLQKLVAQGILEPLP